ncbi:hypothetical protein BJ742DRAFT_734437 [Cladochytrium replicatum]|nr:hypothetical protein BJ742DRAFT_734437 [Cladochytrium replicatum]
MENYEDESFLSVLVAPSLPKETSASPELDLVKVNQDIADMVDMSDLVPIVQIRSTFQRQVLTLGPPGCGNSYLGVVLTQALVRIREIWVKLRHEVGTPPILVLSYKNHAIDEFLIDLVKLSPVSPLIRFFAPYTESHASRYTVGVQQVREELEKLHEDQESLRGFKANLETISCARPESGARHDDEDDEAEKKRRNCSTGAKTSGRVGFQTLTRSGKEDWFESMPTMSLSEALSDAQWSGVDFGAEVANTKE